jgi:hypothetical protein
MRATRDLLRRRLHLVRTRGQLLAHIRGPISPARVRAAPGLSGNPGRRQRALCRSERPQEHRSRPRRRDRQPIGGAVGGWIRPPVGLSRGCCPTPIRSSATSRGCADAADPDRTCRTRAASLDVSRRQRRSGWGADGGRGGARHCPTPTTPTLSCRPFDGGPVVSRVVGATASDIAAVQAREPHAEWRGGSAVRSGLRGERPPEPALAMAPVHTGWGRSPR